jgi:hypothetical protein
VEGSSKKCEDLRKVVEDVVGFGDGEFSTDLSLTLVNSLKTLASEHVMYNNTEAIAGVIRK